MLATLFCAGGCAEGLWSAPSRQSFDLSTRALEPDPTPVVSNGNCMRPSRVVCESDTNSERGEIIKPQSLVVSQSVQPGQNASVLFATSYGPKRIIILLTKPQPVVATLGGIGASYYSSENTLLTARVYVMLVSGSGSEHTIPAHWQAEPGRLANGGLSLCP